MSGRTSQAVMLAVRLVQHRGYSIADAAAKHRVALTSVRRGLVAAGVVMRPPGRPRKA